MDFAFILDPLPALKAYKDTSIAMMRALAARGHRVFALEAADLYWTKQTTAARVVPLELRPGGIPVVIVGVQFERAHARVRGAIAPVDVALLEREHAMPARGDRAHHRDARVLVGLQDG